MLRTSRIAKWSAAITLALLACGSALHVWRLHEQDQRHLREQAEQYAMVLEAHATQVVSAADLVLDGVLRYAHAGAPLDTDTFHARLGGDAGHQALAPRLDNAGALDDLWIIDARGALIARGRAREVPPVNYADRPTVRFHRDQPLHARTFVSAPFPDEIARDAAFQLSRPVLSRSGEYLGVAMVRISIEHFQRFYRALARPPDGQTRPHLALALVRGDGVVLARSHGEGTPVGLRIEGSGPYAALARQTSPGWRQAAPSEYRPFTAWDRDAGDAVVVVRDLGQYPLQVVVSVDPAASRASLWQHTVQTGALALLSAALLLVAFTSLVRSLRQREQEMREMRTLRDAADAASRAKGDFLATVSHEIRTPLNGILGTAELLAREPLSGHAQRLATTLQRSAQTLLSLIGDVLDFAKIEAGRLESNDQAFDARQLLADVVDLFEANARAKGVDLRTEGPGAPVPVRGEAGHLRQALANLVSNALKFTEAGSVTVALDVRPGAGGETLRFRVSDTGVGISDADRAQLFAPFSQVRDGTARTHGGTGLGLAISARLVQSLGGRIDFDSRPGQGSTFWFEVTLPAAWAPPSPDPPPRPAATETPPSDDPPPHPAAVAGDPDGAPPRPWSDTAGKPHPVAAPPRARLLLVEDDPTNRLVVEAQLAALGVACELADDGETAFRRDAAAPWPDLVLLDCNLPGLSGYDVARRWRERERLEGRSRTPLIALTADVTERNARACRDAGMDDFVSKPCGIASLQAVLDRWLPGPVRPGPGTERLSR